MLTHDTALTTGGGSGPSGLCRSGQLFPTFATDYRYCIIILNLETLCTIIYIRCASEPPWQPYGVFLCGLIYFTQLGSVIIVAKNEAIAKAIAADSYLKERKAPSETEQLLYLKEVSYACPLCGKILRHRKQGKKNKLYEIAHIFPNSPTEEQYERLSTLPRLGDHSESFENKIALCKDCHDEQDYHTTQEDYLNLLQKKQHLLRLTDLHEATLTMGLEREIAEVVKKFSTLREEELAALNYTPVRLAKKFTDADFHLKNRISMYVTNYYPYIRDCFKELDGKNGFCLTSLCLQIKSCFIKMECLSDNKSDIFDQLVAWIMRKTQSTSREASEAVISFFVQNCEVFHEITE